MDEVALCLCVWVQAHIHLCISWIFLRSKIDFSRESFALSISGREEHEESTRVWNENMAHVQKENWRKSTWPGRKWGWQFCSLTSFFPNWEAQKRAALGLWEVDIDSFDVIWWAGNHFWNSVTKHVQTIISDYMSPPQKLGFKMSLERVSHFAWIFSLWTVFILFLGL